jgi:hypothetical protein
VTKAVLLPAQIVVTSITASRREKYRGGRLLPTSHRSTQFVALFSQFGTSRMSNLRKFGDRVCQANVGSGVAAAFPCPAYADGQLEAPGHIRFGLGDMKFKDNAGDWRSGYSEYQ